MNLTHNQIRALELLKTVAEFLEEDTGQLDWQELSALGWRDPVELLLSLVAPAVRLDLSELESTEWLQSAFEDIVYCCLQELVIAVREKHQRALDGWLHLQDTLTKYMLDPGINAEVLHWLLHSITEMGLVPTEEFLAADRVWQTKIFESRIEQVDYHASQDVLSDTLQEMLIDYGIENEYEVYELFFNQLTHLPTSVGEEMIASFLEADNPILHEAAVLFLLHPQEEIRSIVLHLFELGFYAKRLSSRSLRRLITIRNWLQASERRRLDLVVKRLRKMGIGCESSVVADGVSVEKVVASSIDGAGAQTIVTVFKEGEMYRLAGSVFKERFGVIDTWVTTLTERSECENIIARIDNEVFTIDVTPSYIELLLPHFIAINVESGHGISPDVLRWVELLGIECWQPQALNESALIRTWRAKYADKLTDSYVDKRQKNSAKWLGNERFTQGWFEQNDVTTATLGKVLDALRLGENDLPLEQYLCQTLMEPVRDKWLSRFVILTLWAQHCTEKSNIEIEDFLVLALALDEKKQIFDIPLMVAIASDSLANFVNKDDMDDTDLDSGSHVIDADMDASEYTITVAQEVAIENFLVSNTVPENTYNFHKIHGLMYATICAPQLPLPSEWLQVAFAGTLPSEDDPLWNEQLKTLFKYYNNIMIAADAGDSFIPCDLNIEQQGYGYIPLAEWCEGLISGVECTGGLAVWEVSMQEKDREYFKNLLKDAESLARYDGLPFTKKNLPDLNIIDDLLGFMDFMAGKRIRHNFNSTV